MNEENMSGEKGQEYSEDLFDDMDSAPVVFENLDTDETKSQPKDVPEEQAAPDLFSEPNDSVNDPIIAAENMATNNSLEGRLVEGEPGEKLEEDHTEEESELVELQEKDDEASDSEMPQINSENTETSENKVAKKSIELKLINLPLGRVKNIMKLDPDVHLMSGEAIALVTKATELFIESLSKECMVHKDPKKKTIQKRDVDQVFSSVDSLNFLEGAMDF